MLPAAALAAGLRHGPPLSTPPDPNVPLGPIEIAATVAPATNHFPVLEMFDVLRAHGATIVIHNDAVPEPSTALLFLLGLTGPALRASVADDPCPTREARAQRPFTGC